jgi:hypothetical protein
MPIARLTASLRNLALTISQLTGKPASPPCATAHDGPVGQSHDHELQANDFAEA